MPLAKPSTKWVARSIFPPILRGRSGLGASPTQPGAKPALFVTGRSSHCIGRELELFAQPCQGTHPEHADGARAAPHAARDLLVRE